MLRVGLVGTSWWAEAMYLPALADHPSGRISVLCGRDRERAQAVGRTWGIDDVVTDPNELIDRVDAVIVASSNASHHPIALPRSSVAATCCARSRSGSMLARPTSWRSRRSAPMSSR